jgi:RNA recognition motif-containing protein
LFSPYASLSQVFFKVSIFYQMNIYVSNLSFAVQDEDLQSYFAEYGEVSSAKVIMDKFTNRSKGFGFVEMSDDAAANKAIAELDGAMVDGRAIRVNVAKPKEDRPKRSFSGNGGGGGNRSFSGNGGGGGNRW